MRRIPDIFDSSETVKERERVETEARRAELDGLNRRIADLGAALDCIPAKLMLTCGPPYTLNFSEEALRKIDAALAVAGEGKDDPRGT